MRQKSKHLEQLEKKLSDLSVQINSEEICHPYITVLPQGSRLPLSPSSFFSLSLFVFWSRFLFGIRIGNIIAVLNKDARTPSNQCANADDKYWDIHTQCLGSNSITYYFQPSSHVYSASSLY